MSSVARGREHHRADRRRRAAAGRTRRARARARAGSRPRAATRGAPPRQSSDVEEEREAIDDEPRRDARRARGMSSTPYEPERRRDGERRRRSTIVVPSARPPRVVLRPNASASISSSAPTARTRSGESRKRAVATQRSAGARRGARRRPPASPQAADARAAVGSAGAAGRERRASGRAERGVGPASAQAIGRRSLHVVACAIVVGDVRSTAPCIWLRSTFGSEADARRSAMMSGASASDLARVEVGEAACSSACVSGPKNIFCTDGQHVDRREDDAERGADRLRSPLTCPSVLRDERAGDDHELADEAVGAGQTDAGDIVTMTNSAA